MHSHGYDFLKHMEVMCTTITNCSCTVAFLNQGGIQTGVLVIQPETYVVTYLATSYVRIITKAILLMSSIRCVTFYGTYPCTYIH
jgi:hypothetical protein